MTAFVEPLGALASEPDAAALVLALLLGVPSSAQDKASDYWIYVTAPRVPTRSALVHFDGDPEARRRGDDHRRFRWPHGDRGTARADRR